MTEAKYNNYSQVIGQITSLALKDIGDNKEGLGKMTVRANGNLINVDFWNPRKATTNHVSRLFSRLKEGQTVRVGGEMTENEYEDNIYRNLRAYISAQDGIKPNNFQVYREDEEVEEKAVLMFEGDILKMDMSYDNDGKPTLTSKVATFNRYNPETKKEDLSVARVIANTIKNLSDYVKDNEGKMPHVDTGQLDALFERIKNDPSKANALTVLNEFLALGYDTNLFNINLLTLNAHGEMAEECVNEFDAGDNVSLGIGVYNKAKTDEYGFTDGSVSELRIQKIRSVNEKADGVVANEDSLGDVDEEVADLDW